MGEGKKIFIADDDYHFCELYTMALEAEGFRVRCANNGKEALEKIPQETPDLVILDVMMPEADGYQVCRKLRELPDFALTPIIMLTALSTDDDKVKGYDVGADDYITKPFSMRVLKAKVRSLLQRRVPSQGVSGQPAAGRAEPVMAGRAPQPSLVREVIREQTAAAVDAVAPSPAKPTAPVRPLAAGEDLFGCLFGGAIPEGSNILVVGPLGSGKSSFARLFISRGLESGEKCMFVCLDDDPSLVRKELGKGSVGPSACEDQSRICFVDAYSWSGGRSQPAERFAITRSLDLSDLSSLINEAGAALGQAEPSRVGGRRVVDSISSLFLNFDLPYVQRFIAYLARSGHFAGISTVFVVEEGACDEQSLNSIQYIMDGVLEFRREGQRFLSRSRNLKWATAVPGWIDITKTETT